jgi:hypothetical protein
MGTIRNKFGLLRKIPKKFELFGHTVRVEERKAPIEVEPNDGVLCDGYFSPADMLIVMDNALADTTRLETFCHEWVEAANCTVDLKLNHSKIQTLGNLLAQMLRTGK